MSDTKKHDQAYVKIVIEVADLSDIILVESDNCTVQYKSAENFHDLQEISEKKTIEKLLGTLLDMVKERLTMFEVLTKITLSRRKIASSTYLEGASEMVDFLQEVFRLKQPNLLL